MKIMRTLVIGGLFALVIVIYIFQQRIDQQVVGLNPDEVNRNFEIEKGTKITRLEIVNHQKKMEIILEDTASGWMMRKPVDYPADKVVSAGLAAAIRFASKQTRLRGEKDWNEYGLEKPEIEVTVETDSKKKGVLAFGSVSPVGHAVYARWLGERGYILLQPEAKAAFDLTVYSSREKTVFRIPPPEAQDVYIEMGAHAYQWKKNNGKWYWVEPIEKFGKEIPLERMKLVLVALYGFYAKEFLDNNEQSKAELGFFVIHDRIKIKGELGQDEVLEFGNEVPLKNAYYSFRESDSLVFLLDRVNVFRLLDVLRAIENEQDEQDMKPAKIMPSATGRGSL